MSAPAREEVVGLSGVLLAFYGRAWLRCFGITRVCLEPASPSRPGGRLVIRSLDDLPGGVVGFETSGELEAQDYRDVLIPAIESAAERGKVRVVVVIDDFGGLSGGALWEDLKLAGGYFRSLQRFALITDSEWMRHFVTAFGWMVAGEIKHFPMADRARAVQWAAAG